MDLREPVSVNTFGVSNHMFQVLPEIDFFMNGKGLQWRGAMS